MHGVHYADKYEYNSYYEWVYEQIKTIALIVRYWYFWLYLLLQWTTASPHDITSAVLRLECSLDCLSAPTLWRYDVTETYL